MPKGLAGITALIVGGVLAVAMAVPASAASSTQASSGTISESHATTKTVKLQIHAFPKAAPDSLGANFTLICGNDDGIILFTDGYTCMTAGYATYNTNGATVREVATWVGGRIWLHTDAGGSFCGTPNGSYGGMTLQPSPNVGLENVQLSGNFADCTPNINEMYIVNGTDAYGPYLTYNAPSWDSWDNNTGVPPYNVDFPGTIVGIQNATGYRIWFHGSGYSDCLDTGYYAVSGRDVGPTSLQVTNNPASC